MINTKNANQIMRFDSRGGFVEILNSAFPIGKVQFNFVQYDQKTFKQTNKISIYMDIEKAIYLAESILTGRLHGAVRNAKSTGSFDGRPLNDFTSFFTDMGGQNEERAKRPDGKALSRQFKIQIGKVAPWMFRAEQGPGKTNDKGLIVPQGGAETYVNIPMTEENLVIFASKLKMHLQAYISHVYIDYGNIIFSGEEIDTFYNKNKENNFNTVGQEAQPKTEGFKKYHIEQGQGVSYRPQEAKGEYQQPEQPNNAFERKDLPF